MIFFIRIGTPHKILIRFWRKEGWRLFFFDVGFVETSSQFFGMLIVLIIASYKFKILWTIFKSSKSFLRFLDCDSPFENYIYIFLYLCLFRLFVYFISSYRFDETRFSDTKPGFLIGHFRVCDNLERLYRCVDVSPDICLSWWRKPFKSSVFF